MKKEQREQLSKMMTYYLRHDKEVKRSPDGFVAIPDLLELLRKRFDWADEEGLKEVAKKDQKGRYEVRGDSVRATYGHSVEVELDLPEADVDVLYHGTSPEFVKQIMKEGLSPMGRKMVHLSVTMDEAMEVGRRHSPTPVVFEIDVKAARERGAKVLKASEKVYMASKIPPESIKSMRG